MATIGALATFADRIGIVDETVRSLENQLDLLMIYCNDDPSYRHARHITTSGNVKTFNGPNLTDRGKFHFCKELKGLDHVYFSFDDDLIYPPDYVQTMLIALATYGNQAIVSHHGKNVTCKIDKYYRSQTDEEDRRSYRVLGTVIGSHEVNIIGTGCMAFDLRYFCPEDLQEDMMADIEVSVQARDKRMIVLPHLKGWVRYHPAMAGRWTVWDHFQKNNDQTQTNMVNNLLLSK